MINKMVTYKVRRDDLDDVKMLIRELVENIKLNEEDTLLYRALQDGSDPTKFIHFMTFRDDFAEDQHKKSNYCKEFFDNLEEFIESKPEFMNLNRVSFHN